MVSDSNHQSIDQNSSMCSSYGEIMLFGVRLNVDPIRKSVSMNNLSQYIQIQTITRDSSGNNNSNSNSNNFDASTAVATNSGYASADEVVRHHSSGGGRERKRGVPWTEDEHKLFLLGLKKVGKGDWRGISKKFVKTRTPTQVASHAQKYFLRRSNLNRRRRRSSLFDITTDSVAAISMEEQQVHEDNNIQPIQPSTHSSHQIVALPATVGWVPSQISINNQMETVRFNDCGQFNGGSALLVCPISFLPIPIVPRRGDSCLDQKHESDSLSLSLSLNLSLYCDHNNGDGIISVG